MAEHVVDHEEDFPGLMAAVKAELLDNDFDIDLGYEDGARRALDDFTFLTGEAQFRFTDTWEWDFKDYDWTFLWACHAIQWGIGQYDAARVARTGATR